MHEHIISKWRAEKKRQGGKSIKTLKGFCECGNQAPTYKREVWEGDKMISRETLAI